MNIHHTRAMVKEALSGGLDKVDFGAHPVFGFSVPRACPQVPDEVLDPRATWSDPTGYDTKAAELKSMFDEQIKKFR